MLNRKKIIFAIIIGTLIGLWAGNDTLLAQYVTSTLPPPPPPPDTRPSAQQQKTPQLDLQYNVKHTVPQNYDDVQDNREYAADLKTPSNITSVVEFDPETGCYVIHTRLGDNDIVTPYIMSSDEYSNMDFRRSMMEYYRQKNAESAQDKEKDPFNFLDMQFGMGPLEKVFGPGGVQLKTTGSVTINMGVKTNSTDNPALSVSQRRKSYFDFDQKIQANITASVGDKMRFNMSYNTGATFDFDSKNLKLAYEGKEDEIIKNIEAGNVSMTTGSQLIRGSAALFGVKTKLQFGKLTATALVSQQNSESQTVSSKGGSQTTEFYLSADKYDQNRNFFLSHFFRDHYDEWCSKLPLVSSGMHITRIEVWITNKRNNYNESRHIMGFMDVGEGEEINILNPHWIGQSGSLPDNSSNTLMDEIKDNYPDARYMSKASAALAPLKSYGFEGGRDYEKIESARLLTTAEYTLNPSLGYIMLNTALSSDEILAVAYQYTYGGQTYQVGEFSSDITSTDQSLYVKLLKGTTSSPYYPMWDLAMKNVYALGAYSIQKNNFKLNIKYLSDTTGNELTYIPAGAINGVPLLQVMNLDRLDANQETNIDGKFDYLEGYTVQSKTGKIIFPVVEPFGEHLRSKFHDDAIAEKYIYTELYDSTLTVAQQFSDKNKFVLAGEYQSSSGSVIRLNATNVARGSVVVTAGGVTLTENSDYTVDYVMGTVTITNQSIIDAGTNVSVSLENQSTFSMQRKTLLGLDLDYAFNKDFHIGGTIMHYGEKAIGDKVAIGSELVNNTIWGVNLSYNTQFMWLTNLLNKIPTVNAVAPSTLNFRGDFAQLLPHQAKTGSNSGSSYIDDFESTQSGIDMRSPYSWFLSSTPSDPNSESPLFPEATLNGDVAYGKNRALLSWYYVDRLFTQRNSSYAPGYIKNDLDALSYPYAREVAFSEVFPGRELNYGESSVIQTMNLSFYPRERGPYNLDGTNVDQDGYLLFPEKRWGGIMRKIENTNFEQSNIEYIQFWMLDPFMDPDLNNEDGGSLYFNLGEVSEDILKDGLKSYENGLPINGDTTYVTSTVWGKVSSQSSLTYAFDNTNGARILQDVGLDGLSTAEEHKHKAYADFIEELKATLPASTVATMQEDPFSPFNDPASDNYSFYRSGYYDENHYSINDRYKHYNGTDGNSLSQTDASDGQYQTSRSTPDVEDINQDNTLNEYERYFQYHVAIHPDSMLVGKNFITDKQVANVHTRNGETQMATWYQFTIPLASYEKRVGNIQDFSTIRFMRMFMTGFKATTHLRFASLELVRGEWRNYKYNLNLRGEQPAKGTISINTVNIEENASREPVNYVLPPGVSRIIDSGQSQITQLNEQSMQLKVDDLDAGDARGVYRNTDLDLRTYKRLQMFVHNEATIDNETNLRNGDVSLFIRLGSDVKNNYYEYEIPLSVTPPGRYSTNSSSDRLKVWPDENMLDLNLDVLVNAKKNRNAAKMAGVEGVGYSIRYQDVDDAHPNNKVYVMGNPSLSKVRVMLIGVRNNSPTTKSCVVWVDELRVTDFDSEGGWAAKASMTLSMSDIATVNMGFHKETAGFGSVDQSLSMRRLDNYDQYNVAVQSDLGRFIPEKVKLHAPIYYSYSNEKTTPKYNPLDQDVKLKESLDICETKEQKDSIMNYAVTVRTAQNFSISGLKFDVKTMKNPMPWDPTNFTFSYSFSKQHMNDPENVYENTNDYRGSMQYSWTPYAKPFKPFSYFINEKNKNMKFFRDWELHWLPTNVSFGTNISRYYYEQQTRNETGIDVELPVSVSKNFLWDRQFVLNWSFTKSLTASFNSNTTAHILEPVGQVNKKLFPDAYRDWRDSVMTSIKDLGTPWAYNQVFNVSYKAPFSQIPILSWITANLSYNSTYKWDRGAIVEGVSSGNIISNQTIRSLDGRLAFEQFYSKIPYLKKIEDRFSSKSTQRSKPTKKEKPKKFSRTIKLSPDSAIIINHKLGVKKIKVSATTTDDKPFKVEFKVKDKDNVEITTLGEENLKFTITEIQSEERHNFFTEMAAYTTRLLMSVRSVNLKLKRTTSLSIPQYMPEIGDIFGQSTHYDVMAPGLDFAFGFAGQSYIDKAMDRNWLMSDPTQTTPALYGCANEFNTEIQLEPIAGLKIKLTGVRMDNRTNQIQFMYENPTILYGGSYTKTHIALATALKTVKADDNYHSANFDKFLENIPIIAERLQQRYMGTTYPDVGFLHNTAMAGNTYSIENGAVNKSSSDVLIPAFMAAYSGKNASTYDLNPFPSLKGILPNWTITYDGLMRIPLFKKLFKSFTLKHGYSCAYNVGTYNSFSDWVTIGDGLGFTKDVLTGGAIPSSPYNISTVSLREEFKPLIGFDATFFNDITINLQFEEKRELKLNPSAGQLVEDYGRSFQVGGSYKIANFNQVLKLKNKQQNVNNDLTINILAKMTSNMALIRKIDANTAQATSGTQTWNINFTADYVVSKRIKLGAYFDYQTNTPLVSTTSYPTTNSNYGIRITMDLVK